MAVGVIISRSMARMPCRRPSGGPPRTREVARADVFEIGEAVEELAADEVEISVAVEVGEVRRGPAEGFDRVIRGL